jgi:hypothetical protein
MNKTSHKPSLLGILAIALLSGALLLPGQAAARDGHGGNDRGGNDRNAKSSSYSANASSRNSNQSSYSQRYAQAQREQQARDQQQRQMAAQRAAAARKPAAPVAAATTVGPVADVAAVAPSQPAPTPTRSQPTLIKGVSKSNVYEPKGFAPQTTELLYALAIASSATGLAIIATDLRRRFSSDQILGRRVTAMR